MGRPGARQHNLKNLDLDLRTGEMTVVTVPSGSGKSRLVFDTLYGGFGRELDQAVRRRRIKHRPASATPTSAIEAGSGTLLGFVEPKVTLS